GIVMSPAMVVHDLVAGMHMLFQPESRGMMAGPVGMQRLQRLGQAECQHEQETEYRGLRIDTGESRSANLDLQTSILDPRCSPQPMPQAGGTGFHATPPLPDSSRKCP